jgi:hypothetical protein
MIFTSRTSPLAEPRAIGGGGSVRCFTSRWCRCEVSKPFGERVNEAAVQPPYHYWNGVVTSRAVRSPECTAPSIQPGHVEVCSPAKWMRPSDVATNRSMCETLVVWSPCRRLLNTPGSAMTESYHLRSFRSQLVLQSERRSRARPVAPTTP